MLNKCGLLALCLKSSSDEGFNRSRPCAVAEGVIEGIEHIPVEGYADDFSLFVPGFSPPAHAFRSTLEYMKYSQGRSADSPNLLVGSVCPTASRPPTKPLQGVQGDKVRGSGGAFGRPPLPAARFARRREDRGSAGWGDREPTEETERLGEDWFFARRARTPNRQRIGVHVLQGIPGTLQVIGFNCCDDLRQPIEGIFSHLHRESSCLWISRAAPRNPKINKMEMDGENIPPKGGNRA